MASSSSSLFRRVRLTAVGWGLGSLALGANALNLTLPTTNLDAESTFSFSGTASRLMDNMGIGVSALGNSRSVGGSNWQFMMPVTQVTLDVGLFSLAPVSGFATGSGLKIQGYDGALTLANFGLDFKRNVLTADLSTGAGTFKNFDVYSFTVDQGLHLSTSGGLSMAMNLTGMKLTTGAQAQFSSALQLEPYAVAVLSMVDFGSLSVDISPALRFGLSDKALVATIPEPPRFATLGLGLLGLAFVARRRMS